jgi:hypothetical protein
MPKLPMVAADMLGGCLLLQNWLSVWKVRGGQRQQRQERQENEGSLHFATVEYMSYVCPQQSTLQSQFTLPGTVAVPCRAVP